MPPHPAGGLVVDHEMRYAGRELVGKDAIEMPVNARDGGDRIPQQIPVCNIKNRLLDGGVFLPGL